MGWLKSMFSADILSIRITKICKITTISIFNLVLTSLTHASRDSCRQKYLLYVACLCQLGSWCFYEFVFLMIIHGIIIVWHTFQKVLLSALCKQSCASLSVYHIETPICSPCKVKLDPNWINSFLSLKSLGKAKSYLIKCTFRVLDGNVLSQLH